MTMPANVERMLSTIAEVIRDLLIFVGVIAALLAGPHFFRPVWPPYGPIRTIRKSQMAGDPGRTLNSNMGEFAAALLWLMRH